MRRGAVGTGRKGQNEELGSKDAYFLPLPLPLSPIVARRLTLDAAKGPSSKQGWARWQDEASPSFLPDVLPLRLHLLTFSGGPHLNGPHPRLASVSCL